MTEAEDEATLWKALCAILTPGLAALVAFVMFLSWPPSRADMEHKITALQEKTQELKHKNDALENERNTSTTRKNVRGNQKTSPLQARRQSSAQRLFKLLLIYDSMVAQKNLWESRGFSQASGSTEARRFLRESQLYARRAERVKRHIVGVSKEKWEQMMSRTWDCRRLQRELGIPVQ